MNFDPKRAARVGAKMLRQRQECRFDKRRIFEAMEDYEELNDDIHTDEDIDNQDSSLNDLSRRK